MTNNMVEYLAFINACVFLIEKSKNFKKKIRKVVFFLDSLLVVNQLNFVWLIKDEKMKFLATNASVLLKKLPFEFCIKHIGREKNTKADDLVNQVLDLIKSS